MADHRDAPIFHEDLGSPFEHELFDDVFNWVFQNGSDFVAARMTPDNITTFKGNVVWDAFVPPPVNDVLNLLTAPEGFLLL